MNTSSYCIVCDNDMLILWSQSLYESIKKEPFKIPEDDGNDLMHTFFNPVKEGWLWKQGLCSFVSPWSVSECTSVVGSLLSLCCLCQWLAVVKCFCVWCRYLTALGRDAVSFCTVVWQLCLYSVCCVAIILHCHYLALERDYYFGRY